MNDPAEKVLQGAPTAPAEDGRSAESRPLDGLERYVELTENVLLWCEYQSHEDVTVTTQALNRVGLPQQQLNVTRDDFKFMKKISEIPASQRQIVHVVFPELTASELEAVRWNAKLNREVLAGVPHAVLFWIPSTQTPAYQLAMPNLWSWNSGGLFELAGVQPSEPRGELT